VSERVEFKDPINTLAYRSFHVHWQS